MNRAQYEEIRSASALNRVHGMDFAWSLNPYQGCVHGCHYCFARRYHLLRDMNAGGDFTGVISVKTNIPELLRKELSRPSWKYETVAIGTSTDPYQPIEGSYRLTRRCLQAFANRGSPVGLVTKGTMVVRDRDVLSDLSAWGGGAVCISITTLDRDLWRRLEPGTPPPMQRLRAVEMLVEAGVNAGVLVAPIIPGMTDGLSNLSAVARAASEHGARFLGGSTLYLKEGTKEHFLEFLNAEYPSLAKSYGRLYPGAYAPRRVQDRVQGIMYKLKRVNGMLDRRFAGSRNPVRGQLRLQLGSSSGPLRIE